MAQQKDTTNAPEITELASVPIDGRIIAVDPGTKRIGIAVSDETQTLPRPLPRIERSSWKKLLERLKVIIEEFDAVAIVIGLPLESDGSESRMSVEARDIARKVKLSITLPVILQGEQVTSYEAKGRLWSQGFDAIESRDLVDSEAAVIILEDFLAELTAFRKLRS